MWKIETSGGLDSRTRVADTKYIVGRKGKEKEKIHRNRALSKTKCFENEKVSKKLSVRPVNNDMCIYYLLLPFYDVLKRCVYLEKVLKRSL